MGRFAYYSPLLIGLGFGLLATGTIVPNVDTLNIGPRVFYYLLSALGAGLTAQVGMVGAQGVWAQVLPVPGGRSIRGRVAVLGGAAILIALVLGLAAGLLFTQSLAWPSIIVGVGASLFALLALGAYAWGWPLAQADFVDAD